jgi:hypothetical protein
MVGMAVAVPAPQKSSHHPVNAHPNLLRFMAASIDLHLHFCKLMMGLNHKLRRAEFHDARFLFADYGMRN